MNLPPGIANSVELVQPEIVLLFLVPVVLLFPFAASVIGWVSGREETEEITLSKEEKEELKRKKEEFKQRKKEAEKARKEREKARKKKKKEDADEWDKALEEIYRG
jgi:monoamine oxidase